MTAVVTVRRANVVRDCSSDTFCQQLFALAPFLVLVFVHDCNPAHGERDVSALPIKRRKAMIWMNVCVSEAWTHTVVDSYCPQVQDLPFCPSSDHLSLITSQLFCSNKIKRTPSSAYCRPVGGSIFVKVGIVPTKSTKKLRRARCQRRYSCIILKKWPLTVFFIQR